jgi:hypothetical protein
VGDDPPVAHESREINVRDRLERGLFRGATGKEAHGGEEGEKKQGF